MFDSDEFAYEIAALLIADIKTSGAQTQREIEDAFRASLRSLLGDVNVPAQIAVLMPTGAERWPRIIVKRRKPSDE